MPPIFPAFLRGNAARIASSRMPSAATQRPVQGDNRPPAVQAERGVTGRKMKVAGCVSAFEPCGVLNLLRRPLPRRHRRPAWGAALKQRDLPRVVRISPAASRMHGRTCTLSMTGRAHARCHCRISYIAKRSDRLRRSAADRHRTGARSGPNSSTAAATAATPRPSVDLPATLWRALHETR